MSVKRIQRILKAMIGPNLEPSIGTRLLIAMTILLVLSISIFLINIQAMDINEFIGIMLLYPIAIFIIGPIIGFPIYFLHELLNHSRLPDFPRRRVSRLIGILFIVLTPLLIVSVQNASSMLLVTGSIYVRLRCPRSPWPRIFYVYGPSWLKQVLIETGGTFLVGAIMGLPNVAVKLASLLVPSLLLGWKLHAVTRVHRKGRPRLPNRCILLLRPFGFDDENFVELNRGFFSILDQGMALHSIRLYVHLSRNSWVPLYHLVIQAISCSAAERNDITWQTLIGELYSKNSYPRQRRSWQSSQPSVRVLHGSSRDFEN
jgi:hypothetical protein